MTRDAAIAQVTEHFDNGAFFDDLARRVAIASTAQVKAFRPQLVRYLAEEMTPALESLGSKFTIHQNSDPRGGPFLLASDGPRLSPDKPTLFMGTRGVLNFELAVDLRDSGHHSGNWGGLISNAATRLANALATIVGPKGEILLPELRPEAIPESVRQVLSQVEVRSGTTGPAVEMDWGHPDLSPAERVYAWNTFEVLAIEAGNPKQVANAIPPNAIAWCQIRFTVDRDPTTFLPAIRSHLDQKGYHDVAVRQKNNSFMMKATRLLPDHPWVQWARASVRQTTGKDPTILPNLGGSLPNNVFAEILGLPTIWVPHSYAACSQHAPNEHVLEPILREGLQIMAGLFWDLGDGEEVSKIPEWRDA